MAIIDPGLAKTLSDFNQNLWDRQEDAYFKQIMEDASEDK